MPPMPRRPCPASTRCPHAVTRDTPCPVHGRPLSPPLPYRWDTNRRDVPRVSGHRLQVWRAQLFSDEPLCRSCAAAGRVTVATIRDHILRVGEGGTDDPTNIQPLCRSCSDAKTHAESRRARRG